MYLMNFLIFFNVRLVVLQTVLTYKSVFNSIDIKGTTICCCTPQVNACHFNVPRASWNITWMDLLNTKKDERLL